jgi:AAA15 family ATPase/GTPase
MMRINSISLKNFKTFKNITIHCDKNFNVIIGPNNVGKSTIIEAILLWQACLKLFVQEKNNNKLHVGYKDRYLSFSELFFIRITNDSDLFYANKKSASIMLSLVINDEIFNLEFNIGKPESIKDSYFKINYKNSISDFEKFASVIFERKNHFNNSIFTYQTKPISQIIKNEPFYNHAQIIKKISLAKSNELIRNKILKSKKKNSAIVKERFEYLENKIQNVLGVNYSIKWKNDNQNDDEYVRITIKEEEKKEVEIALMGSGFLQIVEIFSTLQFINHNENCLNIILIDEPDSHIHSNLQVNLLNELLKEDNLQIFIITHNDRLIDSVMDKGNVLYINDELKELGEIFTSSIETYDFIKNELADKIISISKKDVKKYYVVTEDEKMNLIQKYFELNSFDLNDTDFISYFGCDTIGSAIAIGKYLKLINPDAIIIIHRDCDYLSDEEIEICETKVTKNNFYFLRTEGVDIESQFINSSHISYLYNTISEEKAEEFINIATNESERESLDRLLKKYALKRESGVSVLDLYFNDKARYRYGKKVLGILKSLIQKEIGSNPELISYSPWTENEMLKGILKMEKTEVE